MGVLFFCIDLNKFKNKSLYELKVQFISKIPSSCSDTRSLIGLPQENSYLDSCSTAIIASGIKLYYGQFGSLLDRCKMSCTRGIEVDAAIATIVAELREATMVKDYGNTSGSTFLKMVRHKMGLTCL